MNNKTKNDSALPSTLDKNFLVDTHCHLHMAEYADDIDMVLERSSLQGVKKIVTVGVDLTSSEIAVSLANKYKEVFATIGVHPHDIEGLREEDYLALEKIYRDNSTVIVGFGEIGLDYFRNYSDPAQQRRHFRLQLDIAHTLKLPVVIHNRDADEDILTILHQTKPLDYGGIMHCFSGDYSYAKKILDLGLLISIPGIVTFKKSTTLQEVARHIPLTAIVLETDGPYLSPQPFRGKRNEPGYLVHTATKIAELRQIDFSVVAKQTTNNAEKLFSMTKHNL
ncbi:MAG: TatD family hydrolase [Desulforhopalus sp.]|nr:TatD family hydrolase [Desulforhopalus sp.]